MLRTGIFGNATFAAGFLDHKCIVFLELNLDSQK
jgi:hypothetical protein